MEQYSFMVNWVIDFDNTYFKVDLFKDQLKFLLKNKPFTLIRLLIHQRNWVKIKEKILENVVIEKLKIEELENRNVRGFLDDLRVVENSRIYLVSATPQLFLDRLFLINGDRLFQFDGVIGSRNANLKGKNKLKFIKENINVDFSYMGDSNSDYAIFKEAKEAYLCVDGQIRRLK